MRHTGLFLWVFLFFQCTRTPAAPHFYLHDGDTVVFYGDSITNQRLYSVFLETYVLTRFPHLQVRFVHSGYSGDRVSGGFGGSIEQRLKHDVIAYHPTVVTVMLGMNDGEYHPYTLDLFNRFADGYRYLVERLKSELPGVRLTLLEPSPYDDVTRAPAFPGGYNAVLLRFGDFVRNLAKTEGAVSADLNEPASVVLRTANQRSAEAALDLIPDRVHPSPGIHMILAEALLKAWNAPSLVSRVEIDASTSRVLNAENTAVEDLQHRGKLSWTQADRALPMPLDAPDDTIQLAVACSDFTEALNQELLRVPGLANATYRLLIDGDFVATFDSGQLASGINLANLRTPMSRQAQSVLDLTHRHNHLHHANWRLVEEALKPYGLADTQPAMDALDRLEAEVIALQRQTAVPKVHHYQLVPESLGVRSAR